MKTIAIVLATMMLVGCATQSLSPKKSKNFGVSMEAKPSQDTVKLLSKAQGWKKSGKKNGYVGYAQGESGYTLFTIKKEDLGATCANGADWVITRMALTTQGDENSEKGVASTFGKVQPAWLKEAFPDVDLKTGYLLDVAKQDAQTFLIVENANQQEGEKMVYYEVTLSPCNDQGGKLDPVKSDPAWRNGGRS
jgi:hypothetical protein